MALIKCPECKHGVSDKAEICPNCGYNVGQFIKSPKVRQRKSIIKTVIICALIVCLCIVSGWIICKAINKYKINKLKDKNTQYEYTAYNLAENGKAQQALKEVEKIKGNIILKNEVRNTIVLSTYIVQCRESLKNDTNEGKHVYKCLFDGSGEYSFTTVNFYAVDRIGKRESFNYPLCFIEVTDSEHEKHYLFFDFNFEEMRYEFIRDVTRPDKLIEREENDFLGIDEIQINAVKKEIAELKNNYKPIPCTYHINFMFDDEDYTEAELLSPTLLDLTIF